MSWFTSGAVFLTIWWVVLLTVLPTRAMAAIRARRSIPS